MKYLHTRTPLRFLSGAVMLIGSLGLALGADAPGAGKMQPSKEMREKMAVMHEDMALCLRSDKPMADCRAEMMKKCTATMGAKECPMMDGHHHMMREHSPGTKDQT